MKLDHQPTYTIHKNKLKMDKRLKYKLWHHKSPRGERSQENPGIPCSNIFTDMSPRARDIKERVNKWDFIKLKSFCTAKKTSAKWKGNKPYGKIYLSVIPWTRVWSPKYIKNSHDSIPGRQTTQLKNEKRIWTDTSPRTYRGSRDLWKDSQHH